MSCALGCSPAGNDGGTGRPATPGGGGTATAGSGGDAAQVGGTAGSTVQPVAGSTSGGSSAEGGANANGGTATAGTATGGSASGGAANSPCGTGSIFCTDFEAETIPDKLVFYPEYLRATQALITLDTAVFHGGKRALKVTGTDSSQMLGVAVPSKFWGRVYLRSDTDIQEGHNTYVNAGTGTGDPNDGTYIRIGEHECQLELNRNTDDKELLSNGGMYMCSGGVKLLKDTWYCLEFYYDGPGQETRVFVDDKEVPALHTTDWGTLDYKIFKVGFEKYGGQAKTLWYDDLALAAEQLHCL
ncbi:MAG TPA: hypothetical protein VHB79_39640 [Polyangiaceae bacterium]|nr:hypothetical protein [Polyangiaceae bacterium]